MASYGGGSVGNFYRCMTNAQAHAVLEAAWEAGIRYFDTAPFYGRGRSERRLGAFLQEKPHDSYVISTKVGRILTPARGRVEEDGIFLDPSPFNSRYDYSYDGVMRSYEHSLHRLGLDRVDVLYVHDIGVALHGADAHAQLQTLKRGGLVALEELRKCGDISAYGLGVTEVEACLDCLDYGDPDAFLLAARFTLLDQYDVRPLLSSCLERNVSIVIGGVFNSGILATGAIPGARYNYGAAPAAVMDTVRRIEAVCNRHSIDISTVALQFPLAHPAVATILLGAGTVASLGRNVAAFSIDVPDALWRDLVEDGLLDAELTPKAGFGNGSPARV